MLSRKARARAEALTLLFGLFTSDSAGVIATLVAGVLRVPSPETSPSEEREEPRVVDCFLAGTTTSRALGMLLALVSWVLERAANLEDVRLGVVERVWFN